MKKVKGQICIGDWDDRDGGRARLWWDWLAVVQEYCCYPLSLVLAQTGSAEYVLRWTMEIANSLMSVIGVYLSYLDQGVDCYAEHLQELERLVSHSCLAQLHSSGILMLSLWPGSVNGICKECYCRVWWKDVSSVLSQSVLTSEV